MNRTPQTHTTETERIFLVQKWFEHASLGRERTARVRDEFFGEFQRAVSHHTVKRIVSRFVEENSLADKKSPGRPKTLTTLQNRTKIAEIGDNTDAGANHPAFVAVSTPTIRNSLPEQYPPPRTMTRTTPANVNQVQVNTVFSVSAFTKCVNCCAQFLATDLSLGISSYDADVNGTSRSVYEGLQLLFKSRQSIPQAELDSQQLNLCSPCGTHFQKLMDCYSSFLERSLSDSYVHNLQKEVSDHFSSTTGDRETIPMVHSGPAPPSTHVESNNFPQANHPTGKLPVRFVVPPSSRLPFIILPETPLPTSIPDVVSEPETIVPDCIADEDLDDVATNEQNEPTESNHLDHSYAFWKTLKTSFKQKPTPVAPRIFAKTKRESTQTIRNKILKIYSAVKKNPTTPTKSNLLNDPPINRRKQLLQTRKDDPESNKDHSDNSDSELEEQVRRANAISASTYEFEKRNRPFVCSEMDCTMCFGTQTFLDRHKATEHGVRYPMIPSEFRESLQDLTDEQRALIDSSITYKCDGADCKDVNFDTFKEWVVHQEKDHQLDTGYKDIEKSSVLFPKHKLIRPCPLCGRKCVSTTDIINHIRRKHFNARDFPCGICGKLLSSKTAVEKHTKLIHSDTPLAREFLCTYCGDAFASKGALTLHENTHLDILLNAKTITCETCGKAFSKNYHLERHRIVHSEERNFPCDQCNSTFKSLRSLKTHVFRVHQKDQQIRDKVCEICGNAYAFKSSLKEHFMYIHKMTKEEARVAAKMKRRTIFRVLPNGDRVHKEFKVNPTTCSICNRVYVRRLNLCTHLMSQHGKTEEEARAITGFKSNRKLTRSPTTVGARTRRKRKATGNVAVAVQKEVSEEELSSESEDTSDESEDDDEQEEESQMDFDLNMLS